MVWPFSLKRRWFYGWVMVASFSLIGTTLAGIQFSFGVFFKSIESEFDLNRAATSLIISLLMLIGATFRVLGGWALDKYGPRLVIFLMGSFTTLSLLLTSQTGALWQLFITYSLLLSIGTSANYAITMSTISRWFDKKRGLALGLASAGPGLGMIIMAPFATFLITYLDWRMAYIVMGLITVATVIPASLLLKKDPSEIGALPDGAKPEPLDTQAAEQTSGKNDIQQIGLSIKEAFRTRSFWLFIIIWILFGFSILFLTTHLVPHVTDIGFSAVEAATVLSMIGLAIIGGRIFMGGLSDKIGKKSSLILCALLRFVTILCLIWVHELWTLYLFALAYGFATGGFSPNMASLISDTFGLRRIGAIIGALDVGFGIGAAIGPIVGGYIYDVSNSYSLAFLIGALAMILAILLVLPIRREVSQDSG